MKRKIKELKKRLKDLNKWLRASNKREDKVCLERTQLFKKCLEQQLEIKHLGERASFLR